MTQAINMLPNLYTRLGQIGLFRFEGVTQRAIVIEQREGDCRSEAQRMSGIVAGPELRRV